MSENAVTSDGGAHRLGHHPVIPFRLNPASAPHSAAELAPLARAAVTDISDKVGRLYTLDTGMRPLYTPMRKIIGTALTVRLPAGDNWAIHGALKLAEAGHVLVIDWQGYSEGCGSGALSLMSAIGRGLAGVVIDGAWRDIEDLRSIDFPVVGRGISAFSPSKLNFGEINVPVSCGGVIIEPGDVVVADEEGAVVVPSAHLGIVAAALPEIPAETGFEALVAASTKYNTGIMADQYHLAHERMMTEQGKR